MRSSEDDDYVVERPVWRLSKKEEQNDSSKNLQLVGDLKGKFFIFFFFTDKVVDDTVIITI